MQTTSGASEERKQRSTAGFRSRIRVLRWVSQLSFLVAFLFLVTGTVCTAILSKGIAVTEPLGALQVVLAGNMLASSLTGTLIVGVLIFVAFVILSGRAFCAWACPVGTTIDAIDLALEKSRFKPLLTRQTKHAHDNPTRNIVRNGTNRYAFLASVLTAPALFKYPVWCAVCPIGTICRGAVSGAELAVGAQILAVPAVGALSLGEKRFWCRYLCPVGGLLTLLSRLNPFVKPRIRPDAQHRDCGACRSICPEGIDICNEKSFTRCTKCLDCYAKCPFGTVTVAWM
jgi:ferredoxin-type protein NapH